MNNYNNNDGLVGSILDAVKPGNIIKKLLIMIVFITLLALDKLVEFGDRALYEDTSILMALYLAYKEALFRAFGTIYPVLKDMVTLQFTYYNTGAYFTLGIGIFFFILLMLILFQPISLFINMIDFKVGHATSLILRLTLTFIVVISISAIVYYVFGETGISSKIIDTGNQTILNLTNVNSSKDLPIIDLI
ncbi:MAG: hypothetical protein KC550_04095 [Nanoarchaeota archaeon]|nr:hypothetical protein [Nanoarchaeota archaeon]